MKNMKLATKISVIVICILTAGLAILWTSMNGNVSSLMERQILENMNEAAETRSEIQKMLRLLHGRRIIQRVTER